MAKKAIIAIIILTVFYLGIAFLAKDATNNVNTKINNHFTELQKSLEY